jgi:hypothetical protein
LINDEVGLVILYSIYFCPLANLSSPTAIYL